MNPGNEERNRDSDNFKIFKLETNTKFTDIFKNLQEHEKIINLATSLKEEIQQLKILKVSKDDLKSME